MSSIVLLIPTKLYKPALLNMIYIIVLIDSKINNSSSLIY